MRSEKKSKKSLSVAEVLLDRPGAGFNCTFDYKVPEAFADIVEPGTKVIVSFGRTSAGAGKTASLERSLTAGVVLALKEKSDFPSLKDIFLVPESPPVPEDVIRLGHFISDYYVSSLEEVVALMFPPGKKYDIVRRVRLSENGLQRPNEVNTLISPDENKLLTSLRKKLSGGAGSNSDLAVATTSLDLPLAGSRYKKSRDYLERLQEAGAIKLEYTVATIASRSPSTEKSPELSDLRTRSLAYLEHLQKEAKVIRLTDHQKEALVQIKGKLDEGSFSGFLLQGVTGSGKTEVYLEAAEHAVKQGKNVLVLVPEIALTPQLFVNFEERFPGKTAVLHSAMKDKERLEQWLHIQSGDIAVVIGVRSAVMAPLPNIGLIVVDEEHETTFKQDSSPRYHARDVAIKRAQVVDAVIVLGSATPSIEMRARSERPPFKRIIMPERVRPANKVSYQIVDLKDDDEGVRLGGVTRALDTAISETLERGEQAIIFLNKRGYSNVAICKNCSQPVKCPNCAVSLVLHRTDNTLKCHHCEIVRPADHVCENCDFREYKFLGAGIQRVEEVLARKYPEANPVRLDSDISRSPGAYLDVLTKFVSGDSRILIGTQMIAKGLDMPNVTLVGIINADSMMYLPDLRSTERTLDLLMQVSGRTGRRDLPGKVVIQTHDPDHFVIHAAKKNDYEYFYKKEIEVRRILFYPPYSRLINVVVGHAEDARSMAIASELAKLIKPHIGSASLLGPAPAPFAKMRGRYRNHFIIKVPADDHQLSAKIKQALRAAIKMLKDKGKLKDAAAAVDVDPAWIL